MEKKFFFAEFKKKTKTKQMSKQLQQFREEVMNQPTNREYIKIYVF